MLASIKNNKIIKVGAAIGATGMLAALIYYSFYSSPIEILPFNKQRDSEFILDMFNKNWYWLIENPEFSEHYYLEHQAPSKRPEDLGIEQIRVMYVNGISVGFTGYYKENFYKGKLHFLLVDEVQRGKGYAEKLMKYAIKELKKMDVKVIWLTTRVSNKPARKLYEKLGFKQYKIEHGFVYYELR